MQNTSPLKKYEPGDEDDPDDSPKRWLDRSVTIKGAAIVLLVELVVVEVPIGIAYLIIQWLWK